jgi:hypothetical protein
MWYKLGMSSGDEEKPTSLERSNIISFTDYLNSKKDTRPSISKFKKILERGLSEGEKIELEAESHRMEALYDIDSEDEAENAIVELTSVVRSLKVRRLILVNFALGFDTARNSGKDDAPEDFERKADERFIRIEQKLSQFRNVPSGSDG